MPGRGPFQQLTAADRAAVIEVLESRVVIPAKTEERLRSAPQIERQLHVLVSVFKTQDGARPFQGRGAWPDELLATKMIAAIRDSELRDQLSRHPDREAKRSFLGMLVVRSIMQESEAELFRRTPSREELERFISELEPQKRDDLNGLDEPQRRRRIQEMYFASRPDPFASEVFALRRMRQRFRPRGGEFGSGGPEMRPGNPPMDRPPDRRGQFKNRKPEDRGPRQSPPDGFEGELRRGPVPPEGGERKRRPGL
jgi:hypothetical protein